MPPDVSGGICHGTPEKTACAVPTPSPGGANLLSLASGHISPNNEADVHEAGGSAVNIKPIAEFGAIALLGAAVFVWTFSQPPRPDQLKAKKSASRQVPVSQVGKRGDKIPAVVQLTPRQLKISSNPVALQTPDQALRSDADLFQVVPANLKLRAGPSSTTRLISVYSRGATFEKVGQQGSWLQVRSTEDGASGWMFSGYLQAAN